MTIALESPWRIVEATVQISLTPLQTGTGGARARDAATAAAFSLLFMKYNRSLGGIVVAQRGGLRFPDDSAYSRLIGASPFAHVTGRATLLLFAPQEGTVLTGTVTHVGPDHVGMSVLRVFHAVLPLTEFFDGYVHEQEIKNGELTNVWRYVGEQYNYEKEIVSRGSHIRFVAKALRSSSSGIGQIDATLNVADELVAELGLGIFPIAPESEDDASKTEDKGMDYATHEGQEDFSDIEGSAPPVRASMQSTDLIVHDMDAFDDDLAAPLR